jgi:predicted transcriptional regulator of viral defense system
VYLMKAFDLNKIRKPYFGYEEIARVRGISLSSAKVTASRYVRQGLLLRLKKNLYVLREVWKAADREDKFRIANLGQSPSYVSLMTALDYYEITTQMQQDFFESVALKRTKEILVDGSVFRYTKIDEKLYFGFKREKSFFIASPEKALLDAFYLMSYGRYALDLSALDADKLDGQMMKRLSRKFPLKTRKMLKKHGYFQAT